MITTLGKLRAGQWIMSREARAPVQVLRIEQRAYSAGGVGFYAYGRIPSGPEVPLAQGGEDYRVELSPAKPTVAVEWDGDDWRVTITGDCIVDHTGE